VGFAAGGVTGRCIGCGGVAIVVDVAVVGVATDGVFGLLATLRLATFFAGLRAEAFFADVLAVRFFGADFALLVFLRVAADFFTALVFFAFFAVFAFFAFFAMIVLPIVRGESFDSTITAGVNSKMRSHQI
jgi:hypothetical protein